MSIKVFDSIFCVNLQNSLSIHGQGNYYGKFGLKAPSRVKIHSFISQQKGPKHKAATPIQVHH